MISHQRKFDLCWKEFHIWLHVSEASSGFPGFAKVSVISCRHACVCLCVCILWEWVAHLFYFSFFCSATTCWVDLLVWKEMGGIVWLVTVYHRLTSFCFPLLCSQIIRLSRWLIPWKLHFMSDFESCSWCFSCTDAAKIWQFNYPGKKTQILLSNNYMCGNL